MIAVNGDRHMLATAGNGSANRHEIDPASFEGTHAFEEKLDGVRAFVRRTVRGGPIEITGRSGAQYADKFPEIVDRFEVEQGSDPFWFDGEIMSPDGFEEANRRTRAPAPTPPPTPGDGGCYFAAFDVPEYAELNYASRRKILLASTGIVSMGGPEVAPVLNVIKREQGEGIIIKRLASKYEFGARSKSWIKFKLLHRLSCIAIGYEPGTGARSEFGAMHLAVLDEAKQLVSVGRVGTGMTEQEIAFLKAELDQHRPLIVEIECLNLTSGSQLRFPVFKGVRTDVPLADCNTDQLSTIPRN